MIEKIVLVVIAFGVWGIYYTIRNAHTEIIKGIESIDERLKKVEEK